MRKKLIVLLGPTAVGKTDLCISIAECLGTFVLTFLGCGTAMFLGCTTPAGVVGTAIAFGLTVVAMAYTIGGISGCHINPAITLEIGRAHV